EGEVSEPRGPVNLFHNGDADLVVIVLDDVGDVLHVHVNLHRGAQYLGRLLSQVIGHVANPSDTHHHLILRLRFFVVVGMKAAAGSAFTFFFLLRVFFTSSGTTGGGASRIFCIRIGRSPSSSGMRI